LKPPPERSSGARGAESAHERALDLQRSGHRGRGRPDQPKRVAFRARDGRPRCKCAHRFRSFQWKHSLANYGERLGHATPAIIGDTLIDHDGAGWINGLDPASGEMRFQHWLGSMASMSAILPIGNGDFITDGSRQQCRVASARRRRLHHLAQPVFAGSLGNRRLPSGHRRAPHLLRLRLAGAAGYLDGHRRSDAERVTHSMPQRRKLVGRRLEAAHFQSVTKPQFRFSRDAGSLSAARWCHGCTRSTRPPAC